MALTRAFVVVLLALASACAGDSEPAVSTTTTTDSTSIPSSRTTNTSTTTANGIVLETGLDWIRVAYDEGVFADATLSDIASFGSMWVAVGVIGDDGALGVWHSSDGVAWETVEASGFEGQTDDLPMMGEFPQCVFSPSIRPVGSAPGPAVTTNGDLLVLGCGEGIWTSVDGTNWTRAAVTTPDYYLPRNIDRTRSISLKYLTVQDVGVGPDGFVAVGRGVYGQDIAEVSHTCAVWVSEDGLTWELPTENKADFWDWGAWYEGEMDAVVYFDGVWISAGTVRIGANEGNMTVWRSADGRTYQTLGEDRAIGTLVEDGQQGINGLLATDSGLIAVGWDSMMKGYASSGYGDRGATGQPAAWVSSDGESWTRLGSDAFVGRGYEVATDIVAGGSQLLAVGAGFEEYDQWGIVWISPDGESWTRVPDDRADRLRPLAAVAAGPSGLVAVGGAGVWVSGDFPIDQP